MAGYIKTAKKSDWQTPPEIFNPLHKQYRFTIDVAASKENALLPRYYTKEDDALSKNWYGEKVWCNPPYGREQIPFIRKAFERRARLSCLLIPARTDTKIWHECILHDNADEIIFLKGRVKFVGGQYAAPFPSAIVLYYGRNL